jgi:uncharacterized protein (DUF488 family)
VSRASSPQPPAPSHRPIIYTIGHSTRSLDDFVALLNAHDVTRLADVRSVPRSRRHPHFAAGALSLSLPAAGIAYRHFPGLGGLRKPRRDSPNTAWRHEGFRGYADYMQTPEFERALDELLVWAADASATSAGVMVEPSGARAPSRGSLEPEAPGPRHPEEHRVPRAVIMCAEAVWWRCHRQLTADALVARGIEVRHITAASAAPRHALTEFARWNGGKLTYPGLV